MKAAQAFPAIAPEAWVEACAKTCASWSKVLP
jgi:hypothetical protein